MSKTIFINNLDTYVSQAIFKELRNDQPGEDGEVPETSNTIFGSFITKDSSSKPEGIKKMLKRSKPNLAKTYISKCDLIVYDLHAGNPEDVQLALDAMSRPPKEDETQKEQTLILISSLLAWDKTPRNLEEIKSPKQMEEDARLAAEAEARANAEAEKAEGGEDQEEGDNKAVEEPAAVSESKSAADKSEGEGASDAEKDENAEGAAPKEEAPKEEVVEAVPVEKPKRKVFLHHPFSESDYTKRKASKEYERIKDVEDRVLNFKREGVKTFVISAGCLYGNEEAIFNSHFEKAWKQRPEKLPVIGEGQNFVPTIHVKDLARMVKKISDSPPENQQYIFGIDNTKKPTQMKLIQAISDGIGTGLVESIDIPIEYAPVHPKQTPLNLHLDWRKFVMLNIKAKPSPVFVAPEGGDGEDAAEGGDNFNWHCKGGLAANIQLVKDEFCKARGLKPFKIAIAGKPCAGKSHFAKHLAAHYDIPHIHKEQVLEDIENWNSEKEAIYKKKHEEKERLRKLEETRKAEAAQRKIEAEKRRKAAEEAERLRKKKEAEKGSGSEQEESEEDKPEAVPDKIEGAAETKAEEPVEDQDAQDDGEKSAMQLKYEAMMRQYEADEADDEDEFVPLEIKTKIHAFRKENSDAKKIPSELLSEAFRWRLSQNDCQNRGYVLDGYPLCYKTALEVFVVTPPQKEKPKPVAEGEDAEAEAPKDEDEELSPEDLKKKYGPRFQEHIYPDSVINLRGDDDFIRQRAAALSKDDNKKWDRENLERRLATYHENNAIDLFAQANTASDLGHPKAAPKKYPLTRFYQEKGTEVFEIDCSGNLFEMFESMRVYVERNGRSYNYLDSVGKLNSKREELLVKEESEAKQNKQTEKESATAEQAKQAALLESKQAERLVTIEKHIEELEECNKLNMRQFLMKQIIPVLTEGMIDVYRVKPTDPVDYLGDYIFKKSNELRKNNKQTKGK